MAAGTEKRRVAVIGAGSWGTGLAIVAARSGHRVSLWARSAHVASQIESTRRNPFYLTEFELPESVFATASLEEALCGAEIILIAVPSHAMRQTAERLRGLIGEGAVVVSATKGIEVDTLKRMSEVVVDCLGQVPFVALSGPSFAREVARGDPTAVVAAGRDLEWCRMVQRELSSAQFRIYTNEDLVGVELGGATKNVIAIAAGVVCGLGFGYNTLAAIITRGLVEMSRLAISQGARVETLAGLAGLGDLVLTCTGELSRNRRVGIELGRGRKLEDILSEMRQVAEGVRTARAIYQMSRDLGIQMPITASVHALLYEGKAAPEAAGELMGRPLKGEWVG